MSQKARSLDLIQSGKGSATGGISPAAYQLLSAPLWVWRQVPFYRMDLRWGWRLQTQAA